MNCVEVQNTGLNLQLPSSRQSDQWNGAGGARLGVTGTALPTDGWPRNKPRELRAGATRGGGGGRLSDRADHGFSLLHRSLARTTRRSGNLVCRPNPWSTTKTGASNHMHLATSEQAYWQWLGPRDCRFFHGGGCRQPGQRQSLGSLPVKPILPVRRDELI